MENEIVQFPRIIFLQQQMMQHFENGSGPEFFELWMTHLPQDLRDNDVMAPRLEFLLNVYFTIYPFRIGIEVCICMVTEVCVHAYTYVCMYVYIYVLYVCMNCKLHPAIPL